MWMSHAMHRRETDWMNGLWIGPSLAHNWWSFPLSLIAETSRAQRSSHGGSPSRSWWEARVSALTAADILFLKHDSIIFRQSSMVYPWWNRLGLCCLAQENWLSPSMNYIQGGMTVWICYCHALEKGCLSPFSLYLCWDLSLYCIIFPFISYRLPYKRE